MKTTTSVKIKCDVCNELVEAKSICHWSGIVEDEVCNHIHICNGCLKKHNLRLQDLSYLFKDKRKHQNIKKESGVYKEKLIQFVSELKPFQYELNDYIKLDWRETLQDRDFRMATLDEASELLNSLHWKWWKDTDREKFSVKDANNIKTELVDILHFLLSRTYYNKDYHLELEDYIYTKPMPYALFDLVDPSLAVSFEAWYNLVNYFGFTLDEMKKEYLKKYTLNKFRKDNGYQEGYYQKEIQIEFPDGGTKTLEDNQVLDLVADSVDFNKHTTEEYILVLYDLFNKAYKEKRFSII